MHSPREISVPWQILKDNCTWRIIGLTHTLTNCTFCQCNQFENKLCHKHCAKQSNEKDVLGLILLGAEQSMKLVRRPKLYVGGYVRLAKVDIPFRKGYKQSFTDELFEVFNIPTRNPSTKNLIDSNREPIEGKFYESELIRVLEKEKS